MVIEGKLGLLKAVQAYALSLASLAELDIKTGLALSDGWSIEVTVAAAHTDAIVGGDSGHRASCAVEPIVAAGAEVQARGTPVFRVGNSVVGDGELVAGDAA